MNLNKQLNIRQYWDLILGSLLLSMGVYLFVSPSGINFGGVIGLSQIIAYFMRSLFPSLGNYDITGIINFLINIPLFIIAFRIMSIGFCIRTFISILIQTLILSFLPPLNTTLVDDLFLNCAFGAIICGIGVGFALRSSSCCGGIDIPCLCIVKRNPGFKTGKISILFNMILFSACLFIFDLKTTMYSIIFVMIMYTVSDRFHYQNINIAALVFTENKEMKQVIMKQLGRGVTFWNGYGAYTNRDKEILFCAINKYEIHEFRRIVLEQDPDAFLTVFEGPMISGGFESRL